MRKGQGKRTIGGGGGLGGNFAWKHGDRKKDHLKDHPKNQTSSGEVRKTKGGKKKRGMEACETLGDSCQGGVVKAKRKFQGRSLTIRGPWHRSL